MSFLRIAYFPEATRDHFQALADQMGGNAAPAGRLVFAAGPVADGWQVVQIWESRELLDAFNQAVFIPALASLGERAFPRPPQVLDFEPLILSVTGRIPRP